MSVYKREKSPYYYFDITLGGRRRRISTHTKDKRLAEKIESEQRSRLLRGDWFGEKERITLTRAFARYYSSHGQFIASSYQIKIYMRRFLEEMGDNTHLDEITNNMVAQYVETRRTAGIAPDTINRELRALQAVVNVARRKWGMATPEIDWPQHKLTPPEPKARYLTHEEARTLIDCAAKHLKPAIKFGLLTGVRLANVVAVRWEDVDWDANLVTFRVKSKSPGGKLHILPMTHALRELLTDIGIQDTGPVFTYRGHPIKKFRNSFNTARKKAGLPKVRFHDLRHTAASWLLQDGADLDLVRDVLGHSDIKTTMRYAQRKRTARLEAMETSLAV